MTYDIAIPYTACYLLVKKDNKLAFLLRSNTDWMNGYYGVPAGKVEKNESYKAAAVREGKEEVGITIKPADLKFIHVQHRREGFDWVDVYFEVTKWQGGVRNAEPQTHSELKWFELNKLPDNVIVSQRAALEEIKADKLYSEYGWR